jgi:hypothetical protein
MDIFHFEVRFLSKSLRRRLANAGFRKADRISDRKTPRA